jgi:hypothetical protein
LRQSETFLLRHRFIARELKVQPGFVACAMPTAINTWQHLPAREIFRPKFAYIFKRPFGK